MKLFCEKILLAYDGSTGSDHALEKVIALSEQNPNLTVHILYINQPPQSMVGVGEAYIVSPEAMEAKVDPEIEQKIAIAKQRLSHIICSTEIITHETPGRKIVQMAKDSHFDLIVIGSRGLGGLKKLILGSISSYVVNNVAIPVLVVK